MPKGSSLFSVEAPVPLRDTTEHGKRHPPHNQQLAPIPGVMEETASTAARSSLTSPDPPRSPTGASPLPRRCLAVTPLIADQRCYGSSPAHLLLISGEAEAPVWPRRGNGAVIGVTTAPNSAETGIWADLSTECGR
jgi:hypothetical protein